MRRILEIINRRKFDPTGRINDLIDRVELLLRMKGKGGTKVTVNPTGIIISTAKPTSVRDFIKWVQLQAEAWLTATAYVVGDVRANEGKIFKCKLDHTSDASKEPDVGVSWETFWEFPTTLTAKDATFNGSVWDVKGDLFNVYNNPNNNGFYDANRFEVVLKINGFWVLINSISFSIGMLDQIKALFKEC